MLANMATSHPLPPSESKSLCFTSEVFSGCLIYLRCFACLLSPVSFTCNVGFCSFSPVFHFFLIFGFFFALLAFPFLCHPIP
jgi:hypothetical protein